MGLLAGFRSYQRKDYTTADGIFTLDQSGACVLVEVTNTDPSNTIFFTPNIVNGSQDFGGIPIALGQTRQIPMTVYNFRATGNCTVIGYRL